MGTANRPELAADAARMERGRDISENFHVTQRGRTWVVPSQAGHGTYRVTLHGEELHCTCADHRFRRMTCKHMYGAALTLEAQSSTQIIEVAA